MNTTQAKIDHIVALRKQARHLKEDAIEIEDSLSIEANALLIEISQYEEIDDLKDLSFSHVTQDTIYYDGSYYDGRDHNNQDIYQKVEYELDAELLYNKQIKAEYLHAIIETFNIEENIKKNKILSLEKAKTEANRATYEKLKKQFEQE
jgi:hypothetical protein